MDIRATGAPMAAPVAAPIPPPPSSSTALVQKYKEKNEFLSGLDSYAPTVPEAVTKYYMQKSGVEVLDERMAKLISLAADHFLATTLREARQYSNMKQSGRATKGNKRKAEAVPTEPILDLEDLERALMEQGVFLRKG